MPRFISFLTGLLLGGDSDGSRLRRGVELVDAGRAPRLILTSGNKQGWLRRAKRYCRGNLSGSGFLP